MNTNTFKNSFMTKFFVLLLIAGIATLAAPMAVQAATQPLVTAVEIVDMPRPAQSGNSAYAFARQRLLGDWNAIPDKTTLLTNQMHEDGPYLIAPGYSLAAKLGAGEPVKFFKLGDKIKFKVTFNIAVAITAVDGSNLPALMLVFDGRSPTPGTTEQRAVYDKAATDALRAASPTVSNEVIFTYTVVEGDDCFGHGLTFVDSAYVGDEHNYITDNVPGSTDTIGGSPGHYVWAWYWFHQIFYWGGREGGRYGNTAPPSSIPRTTAYIHDGLNYLIDTISANVRIHGVIKAPNYTGDLRTAAVDFRTGGFEVDDPNVDVTEADGVTGPFDVEFLFFNYGIGSDEDGVIADTTQGFAAADIKIAGPGVDSDATGWAVSAPVFIGLDHRDPAFPNELGDAPARVKHSASFKVYKATITPPVNYDGDVKITVPAGATMDIAGNPSLASNTLTVPVVSVATTVGVPVKVTRRLPNVALAADSFVVIAHEGATVSNTGLAKRFHAVPNLPNLETFFTGNGGTLELVDTRTTKTLGPIITEIMWGTDLSQTDSKLSQWLEIYNAGAATNLSNYQLKVTPFSTATFSADAKAVDTVGNLGDGKWNVPGQSGRTEAVAASTINPDGIAAVPLISMRRKITFADAKVEEGALKGVNNGTLSGSWEVSTVPALQIGANRLGSPGIAHVTQITRATQTDIPYSPVVINEIGNNTGDANDWIELRNVSDAEVNLKKWELNVIEPSATAGADPDEKNLVSFPDLDYKLGAGQVLLIVNTSPRNSPLARGKKFGDADGMTAVGAAQGQGGIKSDAMFYDAKGGLNALPESGRFLLVLRKANDKEGTADAIVDITGTYFFEKPSLSTHIWPLQATPVGHTNVIDGVADANGFAPGKVYKRNKADSGTVEKDWGVVGYTGIGYDRSAANTDANGGTPGFPNGSLMDKESATGFVGAVTISEIMVNSNDGRQPQWIELRNSSQTQGINLNGWQLKIENVGDVDSRKNVTISLPDKYYLPPNQTILIATRSARKSDELTATRVIVLWDDAQGARKALEVQNARFTMLSTKGFTLYLFEKGQNAGADEAVDTVTMSEDMLTAAKIGDGSERISLIRHHESGVWKPAIETAEITNIASDVYYGNATDVGTPGWSPGDALPVSLSSFLPKRTAAGVVIKWVTQSELNNAGFNILRSATKTGKFVVINPTMIQGAGTTGEKHTYSYTDKTAKPNIVYYYQIEDVSFDGHRQRLTDATRLRGHIGAAGKLTTTWGDLKVQD